MKLVFTILVNRWFWPTSVGPAYIIGDGKIAKIVDFLSRTPSSRIASCCFILEKKLKSISRKIVHKLVLFVYLTSRGTSSSLVHPPKGCKSRTGFWKPGKYFKKFGYYFLAGNFEIKKNIVKSTYLELQVVFYSLSLAKHVHCVLGYVIEMQKLHQHPFLWILISIHLELI